MQVMHAKHAQRVLIKVCGAHLRVCYVPKVSSQRPRVKQVRMSALCAPHTCYQSQAVPPERVVFALKVSYGQTQAYVKSVLLVRTMPGKTLHLALFAGQVSTQWKAVTLRMIVESIPSLFRVGLF